MGQGSKYDRYDRDLERGLAYEDFVYDLMLRRFGIAVVPYRSKEWQNLRGENSGGFEIKFNEKYGETGNLWIEVQRKSSPEQAEYKDSGINRKDNCVFFVTGDYDEVFVFSRRMLEIIMPDYKIQENNTKTSWGFLLPEADARKYAAAIVVVHQSPRNGDETAGQSERMTMEEANREIG